MNDTNSKQRTNNMSRIRKTDTKPEILVRKFLFNEGFRYRIHYSKVVGNPDIVFVKSKIAIFINGCFWHSHENCTLNRQPKSNQEYWIPKIQGNVLRDKKNLSTLTSLGWHTITIWECQLRKAIIEDTLKELVKELNKITKIKNA